MVLDTGKGITVGRMAHQKKVRSSLGFKLTLSLNFGVDAKSKPFGRREV
jgi:hypothetical protein